MYPRLILLLWSLLLISASPPISPGELVHEANLAYEQQDYDRAETLYLQAEERITDPGLTAFNKALTLYQQERWLEAERLFRCVLGDKAIPKERLSRSWYNRGNCLLSLGKEDNANHLRLAILCYENCLDSNAEDPQLIADAKHNLELAKLLWVRARQRENKPADPNQDPPEQDPSYKGKNDGSSDSEEGKNLIPEHKKGFEPTKLDPSKGKLPQKIESKEQSPGPSGAAVLQDVSDTEPLSPELTREFLKIKEEQLRKERLQNRLEAIQLRKANDW
jgi:tetratricopeptide (TPR) repeat protein